MRDFRFMTEAKPAVEAPPEQTWSASGYQRHAAFVPTLGAALLDLLAPTSGERILDLGCGDGALTTQLVERGASVVGVDSSSDMVAAARASGLDARVIDGQALTFEREFDAVFSNAALHWMKEPARVLAGVRRALRDGGRFVAEFGGHGNVAAISVALRAVFASRGVELETPWYFPTAAEYRALLEAAGFAVDYIELFPRPTPLPTDMDGWLQTFANSMLSRIPGAERSAVERDVVTLLKPALCDQAGHWTADYVRLRVAARLPS